MWVYYKCTPTDYSSNKKPCFDTSMKGESGTHQVKVMVNSEIKRTLLFEKLELKTPVMLISLGTPKNSKPKVLFYNSNTGSRISDCSISFEYEKPLITEIRDIFSKKLFGTFDIIGKLKAVEESKKVLCGTLKKECQIRNALLTDDSISIKISVRGKLVDQVSEDVAKKFTLVKLDSYYGL